MHQNCSRSSVASDFTRLLYIRYIHVGIVRGLLKAVNETTCVWYLIGKANNIHIPLQVYSTCTSCSLVVAMVNV